MEQEGQIVQAENVWEGQGLAVAPYFLAEKPRPQKAFENQLEKIISHEQERLELAEQIQQQKNKFIDFAGINPGYAGELVETTDGYAFAEPQTIEHGLTNLRFALLKAVDRYHLRPTLTNYIRSYAAICAMAELTVVEPNFLAWGQQLVKEGKIKAPGIQPEQIDAALSVGLSHSTEVASGQGKTVVDASLAAVARIMLHNDQVHLMVANPQAVIQEERLILKLTNAIGLTAEIMENQEAQEEERTLLKNLLMANQLFSCAKSWQRVYPKEQSVVKLLETRLKGMLNTLNYQHFLKRAVGEADKKPAHLLIGDDKDFVFDFSGTHDGSRWHKGKSFLIVDEELAWRRNTPYVLEAPGANPLETYLPDWIVACATQDVCEQLLKTGLITQEKGEYVLKRDESFVRKLNLHLKHIKETGRLGGENELAIKQAIGLIMASLPQELQTNVYFTNQELLQIIRDATPLEIINPAAYQTAWAQARQLVEGVHYDPQTTGSEVIDEVTGHPMPSHQFQGMVDVALDASHHACSLKPRGADILASTGFLNFVEHAYGKGRVALLSATLADMEDEILFFTGKSLVKSRQWIGEPLVVPQIEIRRDFDSALRRLFMLLNQARKSGRPVEIICNNNLEITKLQTAIDAWQRANPHYHRYEVAPIASQTPRAEETRLFDTAGDIWQMRITNNRGGRMIDIKTTPAADGAGGLLVVLWGPHAGIANVRQGLARTSRVGHEGDSAWITYTTGGYAALDQVSVIKKSETLQKDLKELREGKTDYEESLIEKIHLKQAQELSQGRLFMLLRDRVADLMSLELFDQLAKFRVVEEAHPSGLPIYAYNDKTGEPLSLSDMVSQKFLIDLLNDTFATQVNSLAGDIAYTTAFRHGFSDYNSMISATVQSRFVAEDAIKQLVTDCGNTLKQKAAEIFLALKEHKTYQAEALKHPERHFISGQAVEQLKLKVVTLASRTKTVIFFPAAPQLYLTLELAQTGAPVSSRQYMVRLAQIREGKLDKDLVFSTKILSAGIEEKKEGNQEPISQLKQFLQDVAREYQIEPQMTAALEMLANDKDVPVYSNGKRVVGANGQPITQKVKFFS